MSSSQIVLSAGVRQNLLSLQSTAQLMALTQNRLATGKKVNTALDNPVNFFTSATLQSRASDLSSLLDAMSNGIKTIEAADNGLTSITGAVQSMQSTLRQARQDKSFKFASYALNLPSPPTGTEQVSLSDGSIGTTPINIGLTTGSATATAATFTAGAFAPVDLSTASTAPTAGTNTFAYVGNAAVWNAADEVDVTINVDGAGPQTVTITQAMVLANGTGGALTSGTEFADALNDAIAASPLAGDVTASFAGGNITLTSATTGPSSSVAITAVNGDPDASNTDFGATPFGATVAAGTPGSAGSTGDAISFNLVTEAGTATIVLDSTITAVDITAVTAAELATAINTQANADLGTTGINYATVDTNGDLVFSSGTTGATSSVAISGLTLSGAATSSGIANHAAVNGLAAGSLAAKTVDQMVAEIKGITALQGKIVASNDSGKLRIQNLSTSDLTVTGLDTDGTITGATGTAAIGGNDVRKSLVNQFNTLRDQLDKFADDSYYNGVNLLRGDKLKLVFNETGVSSLEIQAKDQNGNPISVDNIYLQIQSVTNVDFDLDTNIDAMLDTVGKALESLRAQASNFGSNLSIVQNRQDFTKRMITTLQTGADTLVLADANEESANMLALQTRQQLSTTALSLSAQADQAVLRLFQ